MGFHHGTCACRSSIPPRAGGQASDRGPLCPCPRWFSLGQVLLLSNLRAQCAKVGNGLDGLWESSFQKEGFFFLFSFFCNWVWVLTDRLAGLKEQDWVCLLGTRLLTAVPERDRHTDGYSVQGSPGSLPWGTPTPPGASRRSLVAFTLHRVQRLKNLKRLVTEAFCFCSPEARLTVCDYKPLSGPAVLTWLPQVLSHKMFCGIALIEHLLYSRLC